MSRFLATCHPSPVTLYYEWFWKGGESLPSRFAGWRRKVRTPKGAMPCNLVAAVYDRRQTRIHTGGKSRGFPTDSATENRQPRHFGVGVMVKRCGKSAPREAQATRHGKPHRVQGQIGNPGAARSRFRESETDSGYRLLRQMILSVPLCGMQTEFGLQPFQNHFTSKREGRAMRVAFKKSQGLV